MTLGSVKTLIGTELAARLQALELPGIGLYYDTIPSGHERLVVRFWVPVYGTQGRGYDGDTIKRPTVQVDVKHYPAPGSTSTPSPDVAERLWDAVKLERLPGVGLKRLPAARPPAKDLQDGSLWGFHRFQLTV